MGLSKIVTFGELLLRFSKNDHLRLTQSDYFTSKYGGSEANVAVSLAMQGEDVTYTPTPFNLLFRQQAELSLLRLHFTSYASN